MAPHAAAYPVRRAPRPSLLLLLASWCVSVCVAPGARAELAADPAALVDASVHASLGCVDCHDGYAEDAAERPAGKIDCLACHERLGRSHGFHPDLVPEVPVPSAQSDCAACHGTHDIVAAREAFSRAAQAGRCGRCHGEVAEHFFGSAHGDALTEGRPEAPACLSCHRQPLGHGDRGAAKLAVSQLCLSCHLSNPRVVERSPMDVRFIESYGQSVHGSALTRGNADAANCVDCHGSHEMNRALAASSRVSKRQIPETCSRCHSRAAADHALGVHGVALAKGNSDAPVCTDCHGEHRILVHTDPDAPVSARNVSRLVCGSCLASVKLNQRYGLAADRFRTFADSYHGLATRGGATEAVNCASCHGAHAIRPSGDPLSPVAKANLAATCGQCHPGANARFGIGAVHVDEGAREANPWVYWVATAYVWLIVGLVGGLAAHNGIDFVAKIRRKIAVQRGEIPDPPLPHRMHLRLTVNERLQHGALALSFMTLVVSGFMLRYPEAWWVGAIRGWSDNIFEWRGVVHRLAGVVLVATGLWHGLYLAGTRRGRRLLVDLQPRRKDMSDTVGMVRFNLGLTTVKPAFGRFSYFEKAEYWAMLWGSVVMGATGFALWFENTFIGLATKLGYDLARTVHFYEAILATLAIVVWHLYFVVFNPDVYPMNLSWLTGRMSEKEMADGHALELERLKASRRDEATSAEGGVPPKSSEL